MKVIHKRIKKLLPAPPLEGDVLGPETPPQGQLPGAGGAAALPPPTPAVTPVSGPPDFVAGAQGTRAGEPLDTVVQTNQQMIPGQAEGQQGIMFPPEQTTAAELNRLSEQQQQQAPVVTPEPTQAELEAAGQQTLPLPTANVAETTQALATPKQNRQP